MSINRDLHVELEEACRRSTLDRGELGQKLRDFEALALERLTMVHRLEAQVNIVVAAALVSKPRCTVQPQPFPRMHRPLRSGHSCTIASHETQAASGPLLYARSTLFDQ